MKWYVYVFAFVFFASPAFAQQPPAKDIHLDVTVAEAQTILNFVAAGAWKDTNALMQKLIVQINTQMAPPPPAPPSNPPPEAKPSADGSPPEK